MSSGALMALAGLDDFRFAHPSWAWLLWGVAALVAFLVWRERRGSDELAALVAPALQPLLVRRPSPGRRYAQITLVGLACAALVVGLMRPQWGARQVAATRAPAQAANCTANTRTHSRPATRPMSPRVRPVPTSTGSKR